MTIQRKTYLEWLDRWRDRQIIKVVSGVRRCGKSTLFDLYAEKLMAEGVPTDRIVRVNFEDLAFESLCDYRKLHDFVRARLSGKGKCYVFLDEIQHVPEYEKAVDSLLLQDECDLYLTGSNAYFMSGELATRLSGRYVELKMLPLSFAEYFGAVDASVPRQEAFRRYLAFGGFPYLLRYNLDDRERADYLRDVGMSILLKDIVARLKVADVPMLENVMRFLASNVGSETSVTRVAGALKAGGRAIDPKTIDRYIRGLTESLLFYPASRYNIKGRAILQTQPKYYAVDTGLRNQLSPTAEGDVGHQIENVVFLELLRRGFDVHVGRTRKGEIDFVATKNGEKVYYQVAYLLTDENVIAREFGAYEDVPDNYPKFVLSLDAFNLSRNGIRHVNLIDWLLSGETG